MIELYFFSCVRSYWQVPYTAMNTVLSPYRFFFPTLFFNSLSPHSIFITFKTTNEYATMASSMDNTFCCDWLMGFALFMKVKSAIWKRVAHLWSILSCTFPFSNSKSRKCECLLLFKRGKNEKLIPIIGNPLKTSRSRWAKFAILQCSMSKCFL